MVSTSFTLEYLKYRLKYHQQSFKQMLRLQILFNYNDIGNPIFITCFNCDKLLTFPLASS